MKIVRVRYQLSKMSTTVFECLIQKKVKRKDLLVNIQAAILVFKIWYLKHYSCYHLIAVATHEKLVQIPNEFKDLPLEAKPKRGRRAIAKLALEKHSI